MRHPRPSQVGELCSYLGVPALDGVQVALCGGAGRVPEPLLEVGEACTGSRSEALAGVPEGMERDVDADPLPGASESLIHGVPRHSLPGGPDAEELGSGIAARPFRYAVS